MGDNLQIPATTWMPESSKRVKAKGQPSRMTCWLTAYEMLFNSGGENITQYDIENRLRNGGFNLDAAKGGGLLDDDFAKASRILGTGGMYPGCLYTIGGVRAKLQAYGSLMVPLFVNADYRKPNERYHHVIIVLGVDEERNQLVIANPWKQNTMDEPVIQWVNWKWFVEGLPVTESVLAGCQYYKRLPGSARTYDER